MKFLILFAVAALLGSAFCNDECFRAVFKECVREPVPLNRMVLCDDIKYQIECLTRYANACDMQFKEKAEDLVGIVQKICDGGRVEKLFDIEKMCYQRALNNTQCTAPIDDVMRGAKTSEETIKANKKVCTLFQTFSDCLSDSVLDNCQKSSSFFFQLLFSPLSALSDALCEQLILPSDEKDNRPDNFGNLNPYSTVVAFFR